MMGTNGGLKKPKMVSVALILATGILLSTAPPAGADHSFILPADDNGCAVDLQVEAEHSVDRNPIGYGDITFTNLETGATYLQRSRYTGRATFDPLTESWHGTVRGNIWHGFRPGEPGPSGVVQEPGAELLLSGLIEFTFDKNDVLTAFSIRGSYDDLCALLNQTNLTNSPSHEISPSNQDPDCSGVAAAPSDVWPPDQTLRDVSLGGISDPDGDEVRLTIEGVTQDEPVVSSTGPKAAAPDARLSEDRQTVQLRAERDPHADGRVYRIEVSVDDGNGGSCTGVAIVGVRRDQGSDPAVDSGDPYDSLAG